jgi:transcriptional regulator with XRE-family HTH domain
MLPVEHSARVQEVLNRCIRAIEARGVPASAAEIARRTGTADGQVRKILNQERPLRPEFLCRLGEFAGLRVSELFATVGWLPENEALPPFSAALAQETNSALEALEQARPLLDQLTRPPQSAPLAAAEALLADERGGDRFEVRLCQVVSGGRYRAATNAVGEFRLRDGHQPLPYGEAVDLAAAAGSTRAA